MNKSLSLRGEDMATTIVQAAVTPGTAHHRVFYIARGVTVTIRGLTIQHGYVPDDGRGGGIWNDGTLTLTHSLIANDPTGEDCVHFSGGTIRSHGYNLESDGSCRLTDPTDLPSTDPLLGPLQDNGGPTLTHALLPGSPALDAIPWGANGCGTTLLSDQRWQARPQPVGGACDIGAYEVEVAGQPLSAPGVPVGLQGHGLSGPVGGRGRPARARPRQAERHGCRGGGGGDDAE